MPDPDIDIYPSESFGGNERAHLLTAGSIVVSEHMTLDQLLEALIEISHTGPIDLEEAWTEATGRAVRVTLK